MLKNQQDYPLFQNLLYILEKYFEYAFFNVGGKGQCHVNLCIIFVIKLLLFQSIPTTDSDGRVAFTRKTRVVYHKNEKRKIEISTQDIIHRQIGMCVMCLRALWVSPDQGLKWHDNPIPHTAPLEQFFLLLSVHCQMHRDAAV